MVTVLDGAFIQVFLLTIRRDHQPGTEAVRALEEGEGKECLPAGVGGGEGSRREGTPVGQTLAAQGEANDE